MYEYLKKELLNLRKNQIITTDVIVTGILFCLSKTIQIENFNKKSNREDNLMQSYAEIVKTIEAPNLKELFVEFIKTIENSDLKESLDTLFEYSSNIEDFNQIFNHLENSCFDEDDLKDIIKCLIDDFLVKDYYSSMSYPEAVYKLAVSIIAPVNGTFYDGYSKTGQITFIAHQYSLQNGGELSFYLQEVSDFFKALSYVRFYANHISDVNLKSGDPLNEPQFILDNCLSKFNYSIMFPPVFSNERIVSFNQHLMSEFPDIERYSLNYDWLYVLLLISSLDDHGRGAIIMPSSSLFNKQFDDIRRMLICENFIESIITLPTGIFTHTFASMSLLIINKNLTSDAGIMMIDTNKMAIKNDSKRGKANTVLSDENIGKIVKILATNEYNDGLSKYITTDMIITTNLFPNQYVAEKKIYVEEYGEVIVTPLNKLKSNIERLEETGLFYRGLNTSAVISKDEKTSRKIKIIQYTDVKNNILELSNIKEYPINDFTDLKKYGKYKVKPKDIIVSCKGNAIKVCIIPSHEEDIYLSLNFIGIRINQSKYDPRYIKSYLESPTGEYYLKSVQKGSTITTINATDLSSILIPYIPLETQNKLQNDLQKFEENINKKIESLKKMKWENKWNYYKSIDLFLKVKESEDNNDY